MEYLTLPYIKTSKNLNSFNAIIKCWDGNHYTCRTREHTTTRQETHKKNKQNWNTKFLIKFYALQKFFRIKLVFNSYCLYYYQYYYYLKRFNNLLIYKRIFIFNYMLSLVCLDYQLIKVFPFIDSYCILHTL